MNNNNDNSKFKSFKLDKTNIAKKTTNLHTSKKIRYLDLYMFCSFNNNNDLFIDNPNLSTLILSLLINKYFV